MSLVQLRLVLVLVVLVVVPAVLLYMPPLYYLINEVLRHLRRTQRNMSDLIVQVLIRKLSNIRHIYL